MKHIKGIDRGHITLYALSTCVWCKKTKKLLNDLGVEYYFEEVDLLNDEDSEAVMREFNKWNKTGGFPLLVIDNKFSIQGYQEFEIRKNLEK